MYSPPDVRAAQEGAVLFQRSQLGGYVAHRERRGARCGARPQQQVALHDLEARVDELDAVGDALELGRLVLHVHRRRDLAAVVQQRGDAQLVALGLAQREVRERTLVRGAGGVGDQVGENRHAAAVLARVRRLLVDRAHDQLDQALEQRAELAGKAFLGECDRGLRSERLGDRAVGLGERSAGELEHADHDALVIAHRHRERLERALVLLGVRHEATLGALVQRDLVRGRCAAEDAALQAIRVIEQVERADLRVRDVALALDDRP